jgi:hypothetical protein
MKKSFTIKYRDRDGVYGWFECKAEMDLDAMTLFYDFCDEVQERLTFIKFEDN